ncbi:MAG: CvpA family protein [Maritimibacter sp.]
MESFTIVDGGVALIILVSAILAYSRGFVREGLAIAGWIAAAVVGYMLAPQFVPLVKEIPVISTYLAESCELSLLVSFAGVLALTLVVISLFTPLFSSIIQRSSLGGIDQALGFVFGVLRGILLVAVALVIYDKVMTEDSLEIVDNSQTANIFARTAQNIDEQIPEDAPGWIVGRYEELVSTCTAGGPTDEPTPAPEEAPAQ